MTVHSAAQHVEHAGTKLRPTVRQRSTPDDDEYHARLNRLVCDLHDAARLEDVIPGGVETELRSLLGVDRLILYLRDRKHHSLIGRYRSGGQLRDRYVYLGPGSVVGFTAMTREPVLIGDVHSTDALRSIHPHLRFDPGHDREIGSRSRAVCAVPVLSKGVLFGVLEMVNRTRGGEFSLAELGRIQEVARFLGQKRRYDVRATCSPFEFLVRTRRIGPEVLDDLDRACQRCTSALARALISDLGLPPDLVGGSMERYYQVPYQAFDPTLTPLAMTLKRIGRDELRTRGMVPLSGESGRTIVLTENPNDTPSILELQQALHLRQYDLRVALRQDILRYLDATH